MIKTTYHCDKCKKKVKEKKDLYSIGIRFKYVTGAYDDAQKSQRDLCSVCAKKIGLCTLEWDEKRQANINKVPNVQDQLYDIFYDMVNDATSNQ